MREAGSITFHGTPGHPPHVIYYNANDTVCLNEHGDLRIIHSGACIEVHTYDRNTGLEWTNLADGSASRMNEQ